MFVAPSEHKIYGSVTVNAKWQIVIPADARERLGIKPWDQLLVTSKWDIVIWLIKADNLEEFVTKIEKDSPGFFDNCKHDIHKLKDHVSGQK
jgi:AbrB family looped-hinge helix DNA binding protein